MGWSNHLEPDTWSHISVPLKLRCIAAQVGRGGFEQTAASTALEACRTSIKHPAVPPLRSRWSHNSKITAKNYQVMAECITADMGGLKEVRDERLLYRRCRAMRVILQPLEPETFFPPFFDVCQHRQNQSTSPKTIRQREASAPHLSQQIK